MAYIHPELFQQQQELLEHERDRAAGEAYLNAYNKHVYGDDHTQCRHYRFPHPDQRPRSSGLGPAVEEQVMCESEFRRRQLFHEAVILDHLSELVWQTRLVRGELEKMNAVLSTPTADADCACACDTEPDVLAECDAPGWFHHSDGDEEEEDSLERFQCNSCGSDHPHFAAAFAVPPRPTKEEEGEKENKPTEEESKGQWEGKRSEAGTATRGGACCS
ncbi:hypothetical protein PG987_014424 [Apiospora arundinis]